MSDSYGSPHPGGRHAGYSDTRDYTYDAGLDAADCQEYEWQGKHAGWSYYGSSHREQPAHRAGRHGEGHQLVDPGYSGDLAYTWCSGSDSLTYD